MIKYENREGIIEGSPEEIMVEFTYIIKHVHEIIEKTLGREAADDFIVIAGLLAFKTSEELSQISDEFHDAKQKGDKRKMRAIYDQMARKGEKRCN